MLQMDLPHLNVLTKIDKIASYGPLPFKLGFYTEVHDLSYILPHLAAENSRMLNSKFEGLNSAVVELVEEYGLVGFETLAVENKRSMISLLQAIDRASGYVFGGAEGANDTIWQVAMRESSSGLTIQDVQERWIDRKHELDQIERLEEAEEEAATAEASLESRQTVDGDNFTNEADGLSNALTCDNGIKVIRKN